MTSRTFHISIGAVAVIVAFGISTPARAQGGDTGESAECDKAAKLVRAYDQSAVNSGGLAHQGIGKLEKRQMASARLLTCGELGGTTAASTIRSSRTLSDTSTLKELVSPFGNFRDSAVVSAAVSVAGDPSASITARVFALRTLWVLRTGKFWIPYSQMLPTSESTPANPMAGCDDGMQRSHTVPFWYVGVEPPVGWESELVALARQLLADTSQPEGVRAAARCAVRP